MYVNPKGKGRHNLISVGDKFTNNKDERVVVISVESHKNIEVVFDDGVIGNYEAGQLRKAMFNHPNRYSSIIGERCTHDETTTGKNNNGNSFLVGFDALPEHRDAGCK